jgi:hypothetical protein
MKSSFGYQIGLTLKCQITKIFATIGQEKPDFNYIDTPKVYFIIYIAHSPTYIVYTTFIFYIIKFSK